MAGGGATCGRRGGPGARYLRSGGGCCFREPPLAGQEPGRALALWRAAGRGDAQAPPTGILGHSGWAGAEKCLSDHVLKPSTSGVGNAAAAWCWIARGKGRKAQHFSRPKAKAGAYNGLPQSSGVSGRRCVHGPRGLPSAVWVSPLLTPSPASYFSCNWDIRRGFASNCLPRGRWYGAQSHFTVLQSHNHGCPPVLLCASRVAPMSTCLHATATSC
ncbi:uncharacterized protein LOC132004952 [Mustela nigripes]|uniref:uncharacterized protein LOC132004952 n=1 Tax=Mustela nigripes TaxID=77151 RepID=UPI00281613DF|nr:uncharacterized protein LOC132004952 [Mustela nigripes]